MCAGATPLDKGAILSSGDEMMNHGYSRSDLLVLAHLTLRAGLTVRDLVLVLPPGDDDRMADAVAHAEALVRILQDYHADVVDRKIV